MFKGPVTNEVFTGDFEKFSRYCSGCPREVSTSLLDCDTELKSTSESSDKENTYMLSDGSIIIAGAECFRCAEMLPQPSLLAKKPAESTTLLPRTPENATLTLAMVCTPESCCTLVSPFAKGLVSTRRRDAT